MESSVVSTARNPLQLDFGRLRGFAVGVVVLAALAMPVGARAQGAKAKEVPKFELSAGSLGIKELPPLFLLEETEGADGKVVRNWVPFVVPFGGRGAPVTVPLKAPVRLYTGDPGKPGDPKSAKMEPYLDVPATKAGERLFLLFHLDAKGQPKHTFLEDADKSHQAGTVRVVNLTGQRIAVSVGGAPVPVLGGGQQVATPVLREDGRFAFKHFEEQAGGVPYEAPLKYLRFPREDMRLTVIFAPMEVPAETDDTGKPLGPPTFQAQAMRLYDRQPGYVAGTTARTQLPSAPVLAAPTPVSESGASTTRSVRECSIGVLALGRKWDGGELELGVAGQSGTARAALRPGAVVPVKVPAAGEAQVSLRAGGAPLGEVTLGGSVTNALLALAPPAHVNDPTTFRLFETSEQSHPGGKVRIFNLTPYQLAFTTGKTPVYVNPQGSALVDADGAPGAELPMQLALEVDGKWILIDKTPRKAPARNVRTGLFVFPSDRQIGETQFSVLEKTL